MMKRYPRCASSADRAINTESVDGTDSPTNVEQLEVDGAVLQNARRRVGVGLGVTQNGPAACLLMKNRKVRVVRVRRSGGRADGRALDSLVTQRWIREGKN